ncbi:UDP-galactopyranose mutase [bacterium K02(2017)]|nr:UDP-galactopyranose mutase [bacterium K02(2017)]
MKKVLIIGGGFAGLSAGHILSMQGGWDITLIEAAPFLGGGCKTHFYGGHPYTLGPRHFLTPHEHLYEFLNKYVPMRKIPEHEFLTYIEKDPGFYNFPIHKDDIADMPDKEKIYSELECRKPAEKATNLEEYWKSSVGETLFEKFINGYTKKMWQIDSCTEFDQFKWSEKGVALKEGPKAAWNEAISAFPLAMNGYDDYFDVAARDLNVHLNTWIEDFDLENSKVKVDGQWHQYDIIINSISPEIVMKNAFGPLKWVGRDLFKIVLPVKEVFPENVYFLYYANQEPFTRIVEYKKFYTADKDSPTTLICLEIPSDANKLYPMPMTKYQDQAQKYFDVMPKNVFNVGRAGTYRYIDVDDCIEQAMELGKNLK